MDQENRKMRNRLKQSILIGSSFTLGMIAGITVSRVKSFDDLNAFRESLQSAEAWLRKIKDEVGGNLKRKAPAGSLSTEEDLGYV